jgi:rsbT antagonist protein RsbS
VTVPILKQGRVLIASVQSALSDDDLERLRSGIADLVGKHRSKGVVLDVGALDVLDSYACRTLQAIARVALLRGARTVIAGIQPDVAFSMVRLGLQLDDVQTALDLEEALALLAEAP